VSYEVYGPYIPVVMLITFLALFVWVLHPKNKKKFDDAAQMPLEDDDRPLADDDGTSNGRNEK